MTAKKKRITILYFVLCALPVLAWAIYCLYEGIECGNPVVGVETFFFYPSIYFILIGGVSAYLLWHDGSSIPIFIIALLQLGVEIFLMLFLKGWVSYRYFTINSSDLIYIFYDIFYLLFVSFECYLAVSQLIEKKKAKAAKN